MLLASVFVPCLLILGVVFQLAHVVEGPEHHTAHGHDIPHHHHPTLWQAVRSHYRMLKQLGLPAAAPAT